MRRKEREVTDPKIIDEILAAAVHGHLGLCDDGEPYVVPMSFAWSGGKIFMHCAKEGRKLDVIAKNPKVCFQADARTQLVEAEKACGWGMLYACVMIFGVARLVDDESEKRSAMLSLMRHFRPDFAHIFTREELDTVAIIEIIPEKITCKAREK